MRGTKPTTCPRPRTPGLAATSNHAAGLIVTRPSPLLIATHRSADPMTATLFDLTGDALRLQGRINAAAELLFSDDPAEVAEATAQLETLIDAEADNLREVQAKADAWCWAIDHIRAQAAVRADHARRLAELAKAAEHQAEVLQDRLISALQRVDPEETTWKLPEHSITSRRVTSVELDPELLAADLPEQFQRVKTTYTADKTALKAALAAGQAIDGASLVERRSWTIK